MQWSPFRPLVFAAAAGESQLHGGVFFDRKGSISLPHGVAGVMVFLIFLQVPLIRGPLMMTLNLSFCLPPVVLVPPPLT